MGDRRVSNSCWRSGFFFAIGAERNGEQAHPEGKVKRSPFKIECTPSADSQLGSRNSRTFEIFRNLSGRGLACLTSQKWYLAMGRGGLVGFFEWVSLSDTSRSDWIPKINDRQVPVIGDLRCGACWASRIFVELSR